MNEDIKNHRKSILETIRICKENDILREYFENNEDNVVEMHDEMYYEMKVGEMMLNGFKKQEIIKTLVEEYNLTEEKSSIIVDRFIEDIIRAEINE